MEQEWEKNKVQQFLQNNGEVILVTKKVGVIIIMCVVGDNVHF